MKKGALTVKLSYEELCAYAPQPHPTPDGLDPAAESRICRMTMEKIQKKRPRAFQLHHRILLAAAILAALTITALAAYAISHAHAIQLLGAAPRMALADSAAPSETIDAILDAYSQDLALSSTDNGHTVILESVMGFSTETYSCLYAVLQLKLPPETISGSISECGFHTLEFLRADGAAGHGRTMGFDGSTIQTVFQDGTAGILIEALVREPLDGVPLTLRLADFGLYAKEDHETVLCGGTWEFTFTPELTAGQSLPLDGAAVEELNYSLLEVNLTPFGGRILYDQRLPQLPDALIEQANELAGAETSLDAAMDRIKDAAESGLLTQADADRIIAFFTFPPRPQNVGLLLRDGTELKLEAGNLWDYQALGQEHRTAAFNLYPLDLSQVAAVLLDGVEIPYNAAG